MKSYSYCSLSAVSRLLLVGLQNKGRKEGHHHAPWPSLSLLVCPLVSNLTRRIKRHWKPFCSPFNNTSLRKSIIFESCCYAFGSDDAPPDVNNAAWTFYIRLIEDLKHFAAGIEGSQVPSEVQTILPLLVDISVLNFQSSLLSSWTWRQLKGSTVGAREELALE